MSEKSQTMAEVSAFDRAWPFSLRRPALFSLPMAVLILVVGFLVLTPLFLMILNSFQTARPGQPIVWGLEGWVKAFNTPGILKAMGNTFTLALARQSISLVVGSFFAWLLARTDIPMKGMLEFFFWLSFFLPALPETMGWILLLDPKYGVLNQGLVNVGIVSQPIFNIYSFWGIVWAHMGGTISVKVMLLAPAFRNLDAAFEEASNFRRERLAHFFSHRDSGDDAGDPGNDDTRHHPFAGSFRDRASARHAYRASGLFDQNS
jgi:ABC-type Fe3+ transport system permease subunit